MKQLSKPTSNQKNIVKLQRLIDEIAPLHEERILRGAVMYFYDSQPLIAYKKKRRNLIIQTPGRTPKERRETMREYMTLFGNIKVKPQQSFPASAIRSILIERTKFIDQHPGKVSIYTALSAKSNNGRPVARHEKTAERIKRAEQRYPIVQKITKHPTIGPWVLPVATTIEVGAGLFALLVVLPWLTSFIPDVRVPLPSVNLPDIKLPAINLPSWKLPFSMPDLPDWLEDVLYWFYKTLPIWIALIITVRTIRKKDKNQTPQRHKKQ